MAGLLIFFINKNECPHRESSGEDIMDYEIDSEYIYSAFMQQYGIDLIDIEYMHWHKFKALLQGITDDTMLGKIIGFRSYDGKEKEYLRMKNAWSLPMVLTEEEKEKNKEFNDYFDDKRGT